MAEIKGKWLILEGEHAVLLSQITHVYESVAPGIPPAPPIVVTRLAAIGGDEFWVPEPYKDVLDVILSQE